VKTNSEMTPTIVLRLGYHITLDYNQIQSLAEGKWLNSGVVDYAIKVIDFRMIFQVAGRLLSKKKKRFTIHENSVEPNIP
jgi:hypothetical protein